MGQEMKKQIMYHGERVNFTGKVVQLFKEKRGEEHLFKGIKGVWFGSVYEMVNDTLKLKPKEVESTWEPTELERKEYEAAKIVVRGHRQNILAAMKVKKPHADISKALELIRPFTWHLSSLERRRFMAWFENECSKNPNRKKKRK